MLSAPPQMPVYQQLPFEIVSGHGNVVIDSEGREYLDMYGGHAVAALGHAHPALTKAIAQQAERLTFYSNAVDLKIRRKFCEKLVAMAPENMYAAFLCNSGAESNENALTLARIVTKRKTVVAFEGGFHGRSLLMLSIGGIEKYRKLACLEGEPLYPHVKIVPFNYTDAALKAIGDGCAAVVIEPVQGLGGARTADKAFLQALRDRCDETGSLLVFDEVQCGTGRSGAFTASQALGVHPHVLTLAKGLGGGFPVAATLADRNITDQIGPGMLGTTFGGGPVASAAGLATLETLEKDKLIDNAHQLGKLLHEELSKIPGVKNVRGLGLLVGIETEAETKAIQPVLRDRHLILSGSCIDPHVLRVMPPLTLTRDEALRFVSALKEVLSKL